MVIAYLRISTAKQLLENQVREIENYSENHSIHIDKWVTEVVSEKKSHNNRHAFPHGKTHVNQQVRYIKKSG